ncbi:DUF1080 domain-containing protein [Cesiribacter sp. SM1]|uniref:3-keto-disaccharide hydrolase n=1 Tax=Cesiribacter sp. SM1 TaxID=2861196 RepID=UPI001CD4E22F|nr:DUF1080 domain-containing protein [Cesiribacter sp. SM1]
MVQKISSRLIDSLKRECGLLLLFCIFLSQGAAAQTAMPLNDLSAFRDPAKSWQIAGGVEADLSKPNKLSLSPGTGILVNQPDKRNKGKDLFTQFEHSDLDLELDFMMAPGSNSGIYLQGLYEVQLADSWGVKVPTPANNGGIYERWDDSRPKGQQGYQGYAPRQNVSKAPGLWQHLKISFQAPRFDANGRKTENARLLQVVLNGVLIHENVELLGATRGAISIEERATGPLRFQGDHGPVAFRNIKISNYDKPRPELTDLRYTVYEGAYETEPQYDSLPPEAEGSSVVLTSNLSDLPKKFLIRYRGTLKIQEPGEYRFRMQVPGGAGYVKVGDQYAIRLSRWNPGGSINLPAGEMPFELVYSKYVDWDAPALGLSVAGPGIREYIISDEVTSRGTPVDPILVAASDIPVLRSFMDIPMNGKEGGYRITHAVNVGSEEQVHYTYDLDHGSLVQVWRGGFLDATPMWHDRGDGSSRPTGSVQQLAAPVLSLARLSSPQAAWVSDTTGSGFRSRGYVLNDSGLPTFHYQAWGTTVQDAIRPLEKGQGLRRELQLQNAADGLWVKIAEGTSIEQQEKGKYLIDGQTYYLQLEDAAGAKPQLRSSAGRQELLVPVRNKLVYSIIF